VTNSWQIPFLIGVSDRVRGAFAAEVLLTALFMR
jgi:hypothetical protein